MKKEENYGNREKCDENRNLIDFDKMCNYSGKIQKIIGPESIRS